MVMATIVLEPYASTVTHNVFAKRKHYADLPPQNGPAFAKQLIGDALRQRISDIDHEVCHPGDEDTFFVCDLGEVYRQHIRWKKNLPRVKPFYAVKCNGDPKVLRLLADLGTGFDCASKAEIDQILDLNLSPDRIIYAQPCKTNSYVRHVRSVGVKQMTFDNADELHKIAKLYPEAELFLRIATDDESSLCRLSMKFGASMDTTQDLLTLAQELKLNIVGVSFHVGSGASDPTAFTKAVSDAHDVFVRGRQLGFNMHTLDVGGGFSDETFEDMAAALQTALDDYFPAHSNVNIIAEPGRFYVATAFTIACNIIARRTIENPITSNTGYMVYVNDGIYGNFSCIMYDHQNPEAKVLRCAGQDWYGHPAALSTDSNSVEEDVGSVEYSIWGPTCDGIDRISASTRFTHVLDTGDWLYFENMGAYTKCSATRFNGFSNEHDVIYVCSEVGAKALVA